MAVCVSKMRIAVDAMGGDQAPQIVVEGAVQAARIKDIDIILVGKENQLRKSLTKLHPDSSVSVVDASQVIEMSEQPVRAWRNKPDSSITKALYMLKEGKIEAFVSAGNSGAIVAAALMLLGQIPRIIRPGILIAMPTTRGSCVIIDVGATVDCRPEYLLQFGLMGSIYAQHIFKESNPKVGLLNIGTEISKGSYLLNKSYELLKKHKKLNFIGNIEGNDILSGRVDVVVCDGFVGNILLKFAEGLARSFVDIIKAEISRKKVSVSNISLFQKSLRQVYKKFYSEEYGGGPLLGVQGVCVIAHGASDATAIKNAIYLARNLVQQKVVDSITRELEQA